MTKKVRSGIWKASDRKSATLLRDELLKYQNGTYSNYSGNVENAMAAAFAEYGDTDYWSEFASIPTLKLPSWFSLDQITGADYGYYKDLLQNYESASLKDIAQIIQTIREEKRSDPKDSVSRERAAGLNPDLLQNVGPGDVAEFDNASNQMELPSAAALQQEKNVNAISAFSTISDAGMSFLSSVMSFAGQIQGLETNSLTNTGIELDNFLKGSSDFDSLMLRALPVPEDDSSNGEVSIDTFQSKLGGFLNSDEFKKYPFSKRARKFMDRLADFSSPNSISARSLYEKYVKNYLSDRKDRVNIMSSPLFSGDAGEWISNVSKNISSLELNVWKKMQEVQDLTLEYDKQYYSGLNDRNAGTNRAVDESFQIANDVSRQAAISRNGLPVLEVEAAKGAAEVQKLQNEINKLRQSAIDDAEREFDRIQRELLSGDQWYKVLGRLLLPVLRSVISNGIGSYFNSALSAYAHSQFTPPPAPRVTNNYNSISVPGE